MTTKSPSSSRRRRASLDAAKEEPGCGDCLPGKLFPPPLTNPENCAAVLGDLVAMEETPKDGLIAPMAFGDAACPPSSSSLKTPPDVCPPPKVSTACVSSPHESSSESSKMSASTSESPPSSSSSSPCEGRFTSASSKPPVCGRSIPGVSTAFIPPPPDRFPPRDHTRRPARPGVSVRTGTLSPMAPPARPAEPLGLGLDAVSMYEPFICDPTLSPPNPKSAVASASSLNVGARNVCM
mmetsp:Transcript_2635/g.11932  ORF Transcript_2635/g.11932 Transcript_2635/m.11932 type:complete len:238 (+) Transcript_2635:477-1190(+)